MHEGSGSLACSIYTHIWNDSKVKRYNIHEVEQGEEESIGSKIIIVRDNKQRMSRIQPTDMIIVHERVREELAADIPRERRRGG